MSRKQIFTTSLLCWTLLKSQKKPKEKVLCRLCTFLTGYVVTGHEESLVQSFPDERLDLAFIPSIRVREEDRVVLTCNPSAGRKRWRQADPWDSVANQLVPTRQCFKITVFQKATCFKNIIQGWSLTSTYMYAFMHTHVCTHTHAHAHTKTYLKSLQLEIPFPSSKRKQQTCT